MKPTVLTEETAASLLRAGNEKGLNYFFRQYDTALIYFALRITGDEGAAEDIAANAFITLWENREKLYRPASVKPYLYQVVRNASIGYLRLKKKEKAYQKEAVYLAPIAEEQVLRLEIETKTHHNLYETIQNLPPRMGQIFRMFYFQRKSLAQIAAELEISVNTVRNQKTKAVLALRRSLCSFLLALLYLFT